MVILWLILHHLLAVFKCEDCTRVQADIILLSDASSSIAKWTFDYPVQNFGSQLLTDMPIDGHHVRVGAIDTHGHHYTKIYLDEANSISRLVKQLQLWFKYHGGPCQISESLHKIRTDMFTGRKGDRNTVQNIVVLVSNGHFSNNHAAINEASLLKQNGVLIYPVAIKELFRDPDLTVLKAISSPGATIPIIYPTGSTSEANNLWRQMCNVLKGVSPLNQGSSTTAHRTTHTRSPPPLPSTTVAPTSVGPCIDKVITCGRYGASICTNYHPWAVANCAQYCGYCSGTVPTHGTPQPPTQAGTPTPPTQAPTPNKIFPCVDTISNCKAYGATICIRYSSWASGNCPLFCGYCSPSTSQAHTPPLLTTQGKTPPPPTNAPQTQGKTPPPPTNAPQTQGKTPPPPTQTTTTQKTVPCVDTISNCQAYGATICIQYSSWASGNCPSFCGFCSPATSQGHTTTMSTTQGKTPPLLHSAQQNNGKTPPQPTNAPQTQGKTPPPPTQITTTQIIKGPCVDALLNCKSYGAAICTQYPSWASGNCAKYCGFCSVTHAASSVTTTRKPSTNPNTTAKTHASAQVSSQQCVDVDPDCSIYGLNICKTIPIWAKANCKQFCSLCQSGQPLSTTRSYHWATVPAG